MKATIALAVAMLAAGMGSGVAAAADWEMAATDTGSLTIMHKGAPVVTAEYVAWGPNWAWTGVDLKAGQADADGTPLAGTVGGLGIKVTGRAGRAAENALRFTWDLETAKDLDDVIGLCLEFRLNLDSPSLGAGREEPVLLEGNKGWRWPVGGGQAVTVSFAEPLADVYFERGNKRQIRAFFVAKKAAAGRKTVAMTVELPKGGAIVRSAAERYGPADTAKWFAGAMAHDESPADLAFLNAADKPAGKHGFVKAKGDALVYADGTPARFWGGNLAAYALFTDKEQIRKQARRIARLGFNLMRIHHHDSMNWVDPTVIDKKREDSQHLDAAAMDKLDWWIKCLKDEGVYVWLDLHVGRVFKQGDGIAQGFDEIQRQHGEAKGFCYYNPRLEQLMKAFNEQYLGHVNAYTRFAYKDDPAVMGLLVTNENDLTCHFGNLMLGDKGNPVHNAIFQESVKAFCKKTGLPPDGTGQTWEHGPSKIYLNQQEHLFNRSVLDGLARLGVQVPVATTNYWGAESLCALPALTDGGIIDAHSYGEGEALSTNPRYEANCVPWIAAAQVGGKPLAITEWNVPYPTTDRFTAPLYLASVAALQGWDAPMIYNYSQAPMAEPPTRPDTWSTYYDPALAGLMPAAAIAFRQGHVSPARETYCLKLDRKQLYEQGVDPGRSAAIRTLVERSRLVIGLPDVAELDWDAETAVAAGVREVTDPAQDFIPPGQDCVMSDTGELRRDWRKGLQTIDTPRTQAASGWLGGEAIQLKDVAFRIQTPKATAVVTSLDGAPIAGSKRLLLTVMARVVASPGNRMPYLSEPVSGTLAIRSTVRGLRLVPLGPDGGELESVDLPLEGGAYQVVLPAARGTHWFLVTAGGAK